MEPARRRPDPDAIRLPDPMTADQAVLRTTLLGGLVEAAQAGLDAGRERIALFEIARVYLPSGEPLPEERWRCAGIVAGGYPAARGALETLARRAASCRSASSGTRSRRVPAPGQAARIEAGRLGELHPTRSRGRGACSSSTWRPCSRPSRADPVRGRDHVPRSRQDLAVVVAEDVEAGALVDAALEAAGAGAAGGARLRRLSRRAVPARDASRSRSGSRSSRPSERSPTRTRRNSARGSSTRSASASAPSPGSRQPRLPFGGSPDAADGPGVRGGDAVTRGLRRRDRRGGRPAHERPDPDRGDDHLARREADSRLRAALSRAAADTAGPRARRGVRGGVFLRGPAHGRGRARLGGDGGQHRRAPLREEPRPGLRRAALGGRVPGSSGRARRRASRRPGRDCSTGCGGASTSI